MTSCVKPPGKISYGQRSGPAAVCSSHEFLRRPLDITTRRDK